MEAGNFFFVPFSERFPNSDVLIFHTEDKIACNWRPGRNELETRCGTQAYATVTKQGFFFDPLCNHGDYMKEREDEVEGFSGQVFVHGFIVYEQAEHVDLQTGDTIVYPLFYLDSFRDELTVMQSVVMELHDSGVADKDKVKIIQAKKIRGRILVKDPRFNPEE